MDQISNKKNIQRQRMMRYFIEATFEIIEKEGFDMVTIRKVSDLAGYNSATLYNYFSSLDHLIAFSSLRYLRQYSDELQQVVIPLTDPFERYLKIWECFCRHSFRLPMVYHKIFFTQLNDSISKSIKEYYAIFPEDLIGRNINELENMLTGETIDERTSTALQPLFDAGIFLREDEIEIREICILIYEGMLDRFLSGLWQEEIVAAVDKVVYHIRTSLQPYLQRKR